MKSFLKVLVFSIISLNITQYLFGAFNFGESPYKTWFLLVLAVTLLNYFVKTVLSLVGLPRDGMGFLIINSILTLIILYVLTIFISSLGINEAFLPELIIFGFMLPSKQLDGIWSLVVSGVTLSLVYGFFDWLTSKR